MIGPLIGMVHLGPLPGAPRFSGDLAGVVDAARRDAAVLAAAGFDALMVENFGDAPFHGDDVPDATVAALARCVTAVTEAVDLPVAVNVLRNDALAAVAIAAATGRRRWRDSAGSSPPASRCSPTSTSSTPLRPQDGPWRMPPVTPGSAAAPPASW